MYFKHSRVCVCVSHLADLVEGVLSISSSVFEVVMSWKCPVNVPGDGTVLRGLLTTRQTKRRSRWVKSSEDAVSQTEIQSLNDAQILLNNTVKIFHRGPAVVSVHQYVQFQFYFCSI